jgi:hypothetical protein
VAPVSYAAVLAMAQAAGAGEAPLVTPSDFTLRPPSKASRITPERCPEERPGEIVVCARRGEGPRLRPLVPPQGIEEPKPGLGIDLGGGARAEPRVSEVAMPNGRVSKRVTIDFKIPF